MLSALSFPQFRRLWIGETASTIGDRLAFVAVALLVVERTGSAADVGLVLAVRSLVFVALTLFGGVLADRLPRKNVIIAADAGRFVIQGSFAVLVLVGDAPLGVIIASQALVAGGEAFFIPAYSGLIPQTVPEESIQEAQAATAVSRNTAELLGPALATVFVVATGAAWAFALDALTFLVSLAAVSGLRPRVRGPERRAGARAGILAELAEGYREVRQRTWVWVTIGVFTLLLMLAWSPIFVLGPIVAADHWGSVAWYSVWLTCFGAGVLGASLVLGRVRLERPLLVGMLSLAVWPIDLALFALGAPLPVVCAVAVVNGAGIGVFDVAWTTALAEHIPPAALSRVSAFDYVGSLGLVPVGLVLAGPIGASLGEANVLLAGAGIAVALILVGLVPRSTRELRRVRPAGETAPTPVWTPG